MGLKLVRPRRLLALTLFSCSALTTTAQTLTPTSLGFGNWVVQTTSTSKAVVLNNTTTAPLAISSISVSGDFGQTSTCPIAPATLAAAGSCKVSVTFTPTALGVRTGTLTVGDNASNTPQTAQLSGTGVTPVGLSPSSLAFGNQFVNASSAAKVLTVQNNQTVPLAIAGISTSGDFAQTSNCPLSPNTLAAKLSCTISVTFTPTALGTRTGTLTISDNAPNSPQTASLIGTGTVPVSLSPASLPFASQVISTTSTGKSVTLKNTQTVPLTIWGVSTSGDFAQTSTCPLSPNTLGAAATCAISVTFTPTALGSRTGTLSISDNAPGSPQTASLSGTGTLSGLLSIFVAPTNPNLSIGNQQQFVATGVFSGGQTTNISRFVTWSSSAPPVARVNSTGLAQAVTQGVATITAAYGAVRGTTTITVATPYVTSIAVVPDNTSVPVGASEQFTAVLTYSDGTVEETTNLVSWSSPAATVATVTGSGLAHALAAGSVTITASAESVTGSTPLVVIQPSCAAAPPGFVGWWTGDGNTVDIAGNNSATLQNGATYGNGEVGQAFSFAGNGAAVLINSPVYSPTAGTLMFWFMPTGAGSLTGSYDGTNRTPGLAVDANGNLSWEFGNLSAQPLGRISFNQWSHVAMTYSSSNSEVAVKVYLNGNLAASSIASQNSSWYPQLGFGTYLGAQHPSFSGLMDEVAIFNQVLNVQQIQQAYNAFSGGMCKPTLQSIAVTPVNPSIASGLSQQFDAVGTYSDSTTHDLTTSAAWSSSTPAIAAVNGSGQATALAIGNATIAATFGAETGSTNLSVVPGLTSIQVNPQSPSIAAGTTQQFTATGTFSDGSTQDLTTSVSWSSSVPSIATTTAGGMANGVMSGQATIAATAGSVSGSTVLTVTPATLSAIVVAPASPTIAAGATQPFTATGLFSDSSTQDVTASVSWGSSTPSVATINTSALATGLSPGQTTITAASGSVSNSAVLTVSTAVLTSIAVNPVNPSVLVGNAQQFTATGTYSDNSTQDLTGTATWNSSNSGVASVDSSGLASSLTAGTTTISATVLSVSGSTTLTATVTPPLLQSISITPANPSVAIGQNQQFVATGLYADGSTQDLTSSVSWSSSQPSIAAITTAGLASGLGGGSSTITAALGTISATATLSVNPLALVSIAVTPGNASIALGTKQQFASIGTYADGSTLDLTASTTWSSSAPSVTTVNASGLATSASTGQTTITAAAATIGGSSTLTVSPAALVSIAITPAIQTIPLGTTEQFAATGTFSDGSAQGITGSVHWDSSDGSVATISNAAGSQGLATSAASGSSSISAASGSISDSTTLTVSTATLVSIAVNPSGPSIALGTTQPFTATGTFTDGSTQDLTTSATWGSSNSVVATVSSSAMGTSLATGTATITATLGGIGGSTLLTVTPASVVSIAVSPATAAIPLGLNQAFTAVGTFTDGTAQNLTNSVHWSSSAPSVATVSNTPGSSGMAASTGSGSTVIRARSGTVTGSGNLTVTNAILAAIEVNPQSPSIPIGGSQQFTATGLYTDGSTANITTSVAWASSSAAVATIGNTPGSLGLATSASAGTTIISATSGLVAGSTTMAVQDLLVSISVAPSNAVIGPGTNQQFTATGTYASGLINDVTDSVLWSASSPAVATINSTGLALSQASGQTVITASVGSVSGSATLAILVAPIQHVVIIFQENRTPDNLFQDPVLISRGADIASSGKDSTGHTIQLKKISLNGDFNPGHDHGSFNHMCHLNSATGQCRMDGADLISVSCSAGATDCPAPDLQFGYVDPSQVQPYFQLAEQYTFADRMFQTNQGPSFPAHQFIISGTSAPSAGSNLFAAENPTISAGCDAPAGSTVRLIDPGGKENSNAPIYPCFEDQTLTDLLEAKGHTWRYYTPSSPAIWTGPNAIQHICGPNAGPPNATACVGSDWTNNVVLDQRKVLSDITTNQLRDVSWVVPSGQASDHPAGTDGSGPSWVASVVNAIGNSSYWANTAIFITWDDWGGWYDHVAPPQVLVNCAQWGCGYVYGFRVPLIVVSPYAKAQHISHKRHDFGSILKFIETTFSLPSLGKADVPADDLSDCFDFSQAPLPFQTIHAPLGPDFFLNDTRPPTDPDDD